MGKKRGKGGLVSQILASVSELEGKMKFENILFVVPVCLQDTADLIQVESRVVVTTG